MESEIALNLIPLVKVTALRSWQLENTESPKDFTLFGMVMPVRPEWLNAAQPIDVTLPGIVTLVRPGQ
jgi:hypothetical protein